MKQKKLKTGHALIALGLALSSSLLAQVNGGPAERSGKPVTVADTIEMTLTGAGSFFDAAATSAKAVEFSPDRSKFVFTTQKGDLKKDVIAYSIWMYETATALGSPKPRLVATLESSSNRPAISQLKWLRDNDTLVFLGEQPGETPQIYRVKISGGKLEKLTNQATPIISFAMNDRADAFVYFAEREKPPIFSADELRRGFFVTPGRQWGDLYLNKRKFDTKHQLYLKTAQMRAPQQVGDVTDVGFLSLSPNGEYALFLAFNTHPPASWEQYQGMWDGQITPSRSDCLAGSVGRCPLTLWLVDVGKKSIRPLLNAPLQAKHEGKELAAWTEDNTVLLVNALLPLDDVTGEERSRRESKIYFAEVTVPGGEIHIIEERDKALGVGTIAAESDRVVVGPQLVNSFEVPYEFRKHEGKWEVRQISREEAEPRLPLSVRVEQGINTPPKLVAEDAKTKQTAVLMDLNPQFREMTFGRVEVFTWKSRDGVANGGELYYPVGYVAGHRYPLVIQTHGESREMFWIQGPFSTTNAAQALANKGFVVLQMGWGDRYDKNGWNAFLKAWSSADEGPFFTASVEAAIDELDRKGLIDRQRVGFSGFSRTVYQGEYLMTHSSYPIGAAVLADGVDFGYVNCIYYMVPDFSSVCEKMNAGGAPWGESLANWEKASPTMRLDKIHTPLLMQSILAPLGEWEIYAGLQWLKKPVELVNFYPEGAHELVRPQQKLLSEQSAVDWYCFWLKGEEDPDPAKKEMYARWHELRKLQVQDQKKRVGQTGLDKN